MEEVVLMKVVEILLVEDNPADVRFLNETLKELGVINRLHPVSDGEQALLFLRRSEESFVGAPRPELVLLDTRMPKLDGVEVYSEMKNDDALKDIPCVILTGLFSEAERAKFAGLHPDCYIEKPVTEERLLAAFRCFANLAIFAVPASQVPAPASQIRSAV